MNWQWIKDRLGLLLTALVISAIFMALSLYANGKEWLSPLMTALVILALVFEVTRLRKRLRQHGIPPRDKD
ncbi:hypothetical protein R69658_08039 [Paraburkholderia aspalathi]|uniref:Uncharacterized protein n=1 Tax=Paraburkholderia aspalathi TaxID=1324617 RepID=A0ABM8T8F1_9BURK|nr:hypothetical protein [Paraburkholderia aspalathi]MBK3824252.1 hypothetical protein [Paraburkholderia aspalathi]MBK3836098.1 hypothetical protein [Paraburkholderia aspalathi]MBK3844382.1 hypothetical protein [Paraburkholderia aspalathi]MBK3865867.1 hypothetical protein [Paraburkholderia aspalathi]CAE6869104.1 hypothetical protein R69658_08039 [Paraburkholderia aspalathi]